MKEPIISFEDFSFRYYLRQNKALSNVSLSFQKGEFVIVTGPSGSGKSTLCYSIMGLVPHFYSGEVTGKIISNNYDVLNTPISKITEKIGYIPQQIETSFTTPFVFTEIAFPLEYRDYKKQSICSKIQTISKDLDLENLLHRDPQQISEGEKQKVGFACEAIVDPNIIITDEPLSNLDKKNRSMIFEILKEFKKRKKTIIIFTHDYKYYKSLATRIIEIIEGKINRDLPSDVFIETSSVNKYSLNSKENKIIKSEEENTIIEVENLNFAFKKGFQIRNVNLKVKKNKIIGILGENGSGKTTFLKLLVGLFVKKGGNIRIDGKEIETLKWDGIAKKIGFVPQDPEKYFFEENVMDEIIFVTKNIGKTVNEHEIILMLNESGLLGYKEYSPHSLSHGEKRRLAYLSSIYHNPDILVIDEITNGLDYTNKKWLVEQFIDLKKKGKTIIIVSHEWEWLREFVDEIVFFENGSIKSHIDKKNFKQISEEEIQQRFNETKVVR